MAQKIGMVTTRHEHINCFHYLPHSRNNTAKKKNVSFVFDMVLIRNFIVMKFSQIQ